MLLATPVGIRLLGRGSKNDVDHEGCFYDLHKCPTRPRAENVG